MSHLKQDVGKKDFTHSDENNLAVESSANRYDENEWLSSLISQNDSKVESCADKAGGAKARKTKVYSDYDALFTDLSQLKKLCDLADFTQVPLDKEYWSNYKDFMKRYLKNRNSRKRAIY